ncbi:Casein kinase I-like 3 isoform 1 [Anopheles sinensis]|uniref:Casein kinase I-like 3 isoform 1 n=1 Tax=Anopheles sinensis TaxID=74873 RepID=A0A084W1U1_ANOSI|nr:Casein kinase I-like 3 isoform 1 [Anopheles sinensis]
MLRLRPKRRQGGGSGKYNVETNGTRGKRETGTNGTANNQVHITRNGMEVGVFSWSVLWTQQKQQQQHEGKQTQDKQPLPAGTGNQECLRILEQMTLGGETPKNKGRKNKNVPEMNLLQKPEKPRTSGEDRTGGWLPTSADAAASAAA